MDWVVLWLLAIQLLLGLFSITVSWQHRDGADRIVYVELFVDELDGDNYQYARDGAYNGRAQSVDARAGGRDSD